ncbi:hypothetical protein FQN54_002697 [Arachnomyces sp. PD_36]|nr:hypothetical protein FQN54_002697 [Arachnomyces sp. PD_36]
MSSTPKMLRELFHAKRSSGHEAKLGSAPPDEPTQSVEDDTPSFPEYYFFYGTLRKPSMLQRILELEEEPQLRAAKITGYTLARWGDYPALIDGRENQEVKGYAYLVQSEEQVERLIDYETRTYKVAPLRIIFTDGEDPGEVSGKGFAYAGDAKRLLEKRFDRKLWELQRADNVRRFYH